MKEVTLQLFIKQKTNGEIDESKYSYQGKGVEKESGYFFTYKEEMEGVGDVSTIVKIGESTVSLMRQGNLQMKQEFEKGKTFESMYKSPFGMMRMETHTNKLQINRINGRPSYLSISYQLWLQEQYVGEIEMELEFHWHD